MTPRHAAALELALAHVPVFPCRVGGKEPAGQMVHNGLNGRTIDIGTINAWWAVADWNLAIVPEDVGCYVVDIDPSHGGVVTWAQLPRELYVEQATPKLQVRTPSGGLHLYFGGSLPPSVGTDRRGLGPGVDIRGRGSYVLVPPSVIDGIEYTRT